MPQDVLGGERSGVQLPGSEAASQDGHLGTLRPTRGGGARKVIQNSVFILISDENLSSFSIKTETPRHH